MRLRWSASRARGQAAGVLPLAGLVLAAAVLIILPLLVLLLTALEDGWDAFVEGVGSALPAIWASLWTSATATLLAVAIGGTLAVLTERTDVPGRRGLRLAMLLAFIVPGYVAAVGWLDAYAPGGTLDDLTGVALPALVGPLGIVIVLAVEAAPIVYLIVVAGLAARVEPDLERAARASGANALTAFRTVTLPLLRPVLAGAGAIAFVLGLTSFGVPAVLGVPAGFTTMTTRIYRDLAFSADPASFVRALGLAIVLAVGAAAVLAIADVLLERRRSHRSGAFAGPLGQLGMAGWAPGGEGAGDAGIGTEAAADDRIRRRLRAVRPRAVGLGLLAWAVVGVTVIVPLAALVLTALTRAPGLDPVPANWTLDHFAEIADPRTLDAFLRSALLAGLAAIGVVVLGALVIVSRQGQGSGLVGGLLGLTFALPGSTLAVAVLLAYGVALRDTLLIILIAYLAKFWALGHRPIASGLESLSADLLRAARVSGADALTAARTIVLPVLRPLVVAGGLIVFVFGLHEVTMSSLLYGPGTATLAVVVLDLQQLGSTGPTAALAIVLTLIVAAASLPLLRAGGALASLAGRA